MEIQPASHSIEVCLSPALFPFIHSRPGYLTVVVDILRATTTICAAFGHGIGSVIPVSSQAEALKYKQNGYIVAAEQDGKKLDFADFGNTAFDFIHQHAGGMDIVFCTTNGTVAIETASKSGALVLGAFINLTTLVNWLTKQDKNIVILCSGWRNMFCLEDTLFAGALVERLSSFKMFHTLGDSAYASCDLWLAAKDNVIGYITKAEHRQRLKDLGADDVVDYCFTQDLVTVVPFFRDGKFVDIITNKRQV